MTVRTFNYTGRRLIPQECVDAHLTRMIEAPSLDVTFDFSIAPHVQELPDSAQVFVDATHAMSYMRFDHGTMSRLSPPSNTILSELDSWSSAVFVVRIVDEGVLLAATKPMTLNLAVPDSRTRRALIMPAYEDLGERPWKLRVRWDINLPELVFNERWSVANSRSGLSMQEDRYALSIIMPSVMQGMLEWLLILHRGDPHELYDDPTWKGGWIRFARSLVPPQSVPPSLSEDPEGDNLDDVRSWIEEVVSQYSSTKGLTSYLVDVTSRGA